MKHHLNKHLRKVAWATANVIVFSWLCMEGVPGLKITFYSLFNNGHDEATYPAEIGEYRIKTRLFPGIAYFHEQLGIVLVTHLTYDVDKRQRLREAINAFETCINL